MLVKRFKLQRSQYWDDNNWYDEAETYTIEEAKLIYENHHSRYDYVWRILEVHTLG